MPYCYDKGCDTKVYLWIQNLNKNNIHKCRDHGWEEEKVVLSKKTRKSLVRFQVRLIWKTTSSSHHFTWASSFFFVKLKFPLLILKRPCCQSRFKYNLSIDVVKIPVTIVGVPLWVPVPQRHLGEKISILGKVTMILTTPSSYFIMGLPPPIALEFLDMVIGGSCGVGGSW